MFCEVADNFGFVALWAAMSVSGLLAMLVLSSLIFKPFYVDVTYETWQMKTNPKFPSPELVAREIIQMCKGLSVAILCPVFTLFLSKWNYSNGYCGFDDEKHGLKDALWQIFVIVSFSDLFEYCYHYLGHYSMTFWEIHRHHHKFYNPSPFAVIADEWADQFVRTWPMVIIPLMMSTNMDLLFGVFVFLFYGYGVYLHYGFESKMLSAHNPIFNTSYHHFIHHAHSVKGRPIFTGFFFKIW